MLISSGAKVSGIHAVGEDGAQAKSVTVIWYIKK